MPAGDRWAISMAARRRASQVSRARGRLYVAVPSSSAEAAAAVRLAGHGCGHERPAPASGLPHGAAARSSRPRPLRVRVVFRQQRAPPRTRSSSVRRGCGGRRRTGGLAAPAAHWPLSARSWLRRAPPRNRAATARGRGRQFKAITFRLPRRRRPGTAVPAPQVCRCRRGFRSLPVVARIRRSAPSNSSRGRFAGRARPCRLCRISPATDLAGPAVLQAGNPRRRSDASVGVDNRDAAEPAPPSPPLRAWLRRSILRRPSRARRVPADAHRHELKCGKIPSLAKREFKFPSTREMCAIATLSNCL